MRFAQPILKTLQRLDQGTFEDPWGFGFRMEILRSEHPDWLKWKKENVTDLDDLMDEAADNVAKRIEWKARNGQRRRKMPNSKKMRSLIQEEFKRLRKERGVDVEESERKLREGIAQVLLVRLSNGEEEADEAARLEMLRDRPSNVFPESVEDWPESAGEYRGEIDEDGEIPYGGQSFGNAFRDFILDGAESLEEYRGDELEETAKNSAGPPAGVSAIGAA